MHARYEPDNSRVASEQTLNGDPRTGIDVPCLFTAHFTLTRPRFPARPQQECRNHRMPGISDQAACESYELHIS